MSSRDALAGEGWLKHAAALRALATALTADGSEAEDLVHETWLRAARRGESTDRPRAWWSAILRNLVRDRVRERSQRARKEHEAARDERVPSEVEVLERLEIAQRVAAEVARLDEPYRTAIHLRYFEGLSADEIAQRLNSPLETVRARLRRGLEQLRERMDRACGGDRDLWSAALGALALRAKPASFASTGTSLVCAGVVAMGAKLMLGIAAFAVVGVGVYFLGPKTEPADSLARGVEIEPATPVIAAAAGASRDVAIEPALSARESVAAPIAAKPVAADQATIVVLDENGTEHATESGSFSLDVSKPRGERIQVSVNDGVWSQHLPEGATYYVTKIVLRERSAIALPNAGPFVAGQEAPGLRCEWAKLARLHVVDASSGAELDGIRLYTVPQFDAAGMEVMLQRPKFGLVGEELMSPIDIRYQHDEHGSDPPVHFAGRSGYAWGSIQIDPRAGGDLVLKLQPGGDLYAAFDGASRDPRLRLRVYQPSGSELKWIAEWGGDQLRRGKPPSLDLEGLLVGRYVMRAEVGKQHEPNILAEQEFAIIAGQKAILALAVPALPKKETVEISITLKLDPSWNPEKFNLWMEPLDHPRTLSSPGEHIFAADWTLAEAGIWTAKPILLEEGRYKLTVDELDFGADVTVGPDPRQQLLLEVPAPVRVVVHAIDAESGEPVAGANYNCAWKGPRDDHFFGGNNGRNETALGQLEFVAPLGTIKLEVFTPEYCWASETLALAPGLNELTLKMLRNYRVEFVLHEGERVVPWAMSAMDGIKFEPVKGRGLTGGVSFGSGRLTSVVCKGGVYRVTIPKLPGYQPVEPFEVTLEERKLIERIVQIVRE